MYHHFVPFLGSAIGLVDPQSSYQQQFQAYYSYFLNQYHQQHQLQQFCSSGCHWVLYGDGWYLVPVQGHQHSYSPLDRDLFFRQNNRDFQLWQLGSALATHSYEVKNAFQRVLDVLDKRLTNQDGEIKDIEEKLDDISSSLSSIKSELESLVKQKKVSFPWATLVPASVFSKSPTPSITPISSLPSASEVSLSEADKQYQLMYEISKKLFEAVSKFSGLTAHGKENVIKWLKDQFSISLSDETDKWENFKSLCEDQKTKETKSGDEMVNEHARLCFVDTGESSKGYLWKWYLLPEPQISPRDQIDFDSFSKKNVDLWNEFNSKYPTSNPSSEFSKWYDEAPIIDLSKAFASSTGISLFKSVINQISQRSPESGS